MAAEVGGSSKPDYKHMIAEAIIRWREPVAEFLGIDPGLIDSVPIRIAKIDEFRGEGDMMAYATTSDEGISFNRKALQSGTDIDGLVIHELIHWALNRSGRKLYEASRWIEESIADLIKLRHGLMPEDAWEAHLPGRGRVRSGYAAGANFLLYLETLKPGAIPEIIKEYQTDNARPGSQIISQVMGIPNLKPLAEAFNHLPWAARARVPHGGASAPTPSTPAKYAPETDQSSLGSGKPPAEPIPEIPKITKVEKIQAKRS